jgi:ribosomal protein S27AE
MKRIRKIIKPVSLFLAILMITILTPYQVVLAKMISTETVIESDRAHEARMYVNSILAREDVMASLISQGIDMTEAKARVDSLSNAEIVSLADNIEQLPVAGANPFLMVFLVWVLIDLLVRWPFGHNKRMAKALKFEQRCVKAEICPRCGNGLVVNPEQHNKIMYHCTECGFKER